MVKLPQPPENPPSSKAPTAALVVMAVILIGMLMVAIYSNVQRWRRDKIETVIVTPIPTPSATASVPSG
jgi:cell division septal protein FtsQ